MRIETIEYNLSRISYFFGNPIFKCYQSLIARNGITCDGLLKAYSALLDIHGAPVNNLSYLIINSKDEYLELKYYVQRTFTDTYKEVDALKEAEASAIELRAQTGINELMCLPSEGFYFDYDGYKWCVKYN